MEQKSLSELRELRDKMSQRDLAKQIGLTASAIAMYETGERTPPLEKAKRIAAFFGVPVESIKFGKDARLARKCKPTGTNGK